MIVRHIIFAGLFATASFANAGTVEAPTATVQPAWTFNAGAGASAEAKAFQSALAGPGGTWRAHSRMGDIGSSSTMLFSQRGAAFSSAPVAAVSTSSQPGAVVAAPAAAVAAVAAAAAAAPVTAELLQVAFAETANAPAESTIPAPAAADIAAIVVAADVVSADAPAALAAIPEPATGMLMLVGLLGAGFASRRRK